VQGFHHFHFTLHPYRRSDRDSSGRQSSHAHHGDRYASDPAVGVVHELAEFSFNANGEAIFAHSTTDFLNYHLSRLGAHLQALLKIVPTEIREGLIAGITTSQTDETTGTMTIPQQGW
jgi:hypothetical protein